MEISKGTRQLARNEGVANGYQGKAVQRSGSGRNSRNLPEDALDKDRQSRHRCLQDRSMREGRRARDNPCNFCRLHTGEERSGVSESTATTLPAAGTGGSERNDSMRRAPTNLDV